MSTCVQLLKYLAEFFLKWKNVLDKVVEKIKTRILCPVTLSGKSCRLWDNVEKYGKARQATDNNIIRCMRFACWITKATDTHPEYVIRIPFPRQQWLRERVSLLRFVQCFSCCNNSDIVRIHIWRVVCVSFKYFVAVFLYLLCYVRWNWLPLAVVRVGSGLLTLTMCCA